MAGAFGIRNKKRNELGWLEFAAADSMDISDLFFCHS